MIPDRTPNVEFDLQLQQIDSDLAARALNEKGAVLGELSALQGRLGAARLLGADDIVTRVLALIEERSERLCQIEALISAAPVVEVAISAPAEPESLPEPELPPSPKPTLEPVIRKTVKVEGPKPAPVVSVSVAPPEPPVAKRKPLSGAAFRRMKDSFFARERDVETDPSPLELRQATLKGLACECRAILELATDMNEDPHLFGQSLEHLKALANRLDPDNSFIAFNPSRYHDWKIWRDLGEAFSLVPIANRSLDALSDADLSPSDRELILIGSAAVESWIHRLADEKGLGFTDISQRALHERVEDVHGDVWIPWWDLRGPGAKSTDEVARAAHELEANWTQIQAKIVKKSQRMKADELLRGLEESILGPGDFDSTILSTLKVCFDAGIPPSNPELVDRMTPYLGILRDVAPSDKLIAKLLENIDKRQTKMLAKHCMHRDPIVDDIDEPADEESQQRFEAVRDHLRGKRVLFMGGKPKAERAQDLKRALELADLRWPESDGEKGASYFEADVRKSDVVCYLIRWSRHSYKQMADLAKELDKDVVTLKAGYGLNRFVNDVWSQLIEPHSEHGSGTRSLG